MPTNNYILTPNGCFYSEDELYHHGVKGMKWGVRRYQNEDGSLTNAGKKRYTRAELEKQAGNFQASNGLKVAPAKNAYVRTMRKVAANRNVEKLSEASYRATIGRQHANTLTNQAIAIKEQRMRKESQALREYNAHIKDLRKGTGNKYLNKEIRKNKIDDVYEKVRTASTRKDRLMYNDAIRKKAAKYVVDNNMSVADATKKVKGDARRNTATYVAALSAYTVAELYRNR